MTARYETLSTDPHRWQAELPRPIFDGAMHAETMRFALVDEAEAADLAHEMDSERRLSRSGRLKEDGGEREKFRREVLWWRDATQITYEPSGSVTPRMAEERRRDGWHIARSWLIAAGEKPKWEGPYRFPEDAALAIARYLAAELTNRHTARAKFHKIGTGSPLWACRRPRSCRHARKREPCHE